MIATILTKTLPKSTILIEFKTIMIRRHTFRTIFRGIKRRAFSFKNSSSRVRPTTAETFLQVCPFGGIRLIQHDIHIGCL